MTDLEAGEKTVMPKLTVRLQQWREVFGKRVKGMWIGGIFERELVIYAPLDALRAGVPMSGKRQCNGKG